MNSGELKRAKRDVRRQILALRDATTPQHRAEAALMVRDRCMELGEVGASRVAMAFWTFGSELPTLPLMEALVAAGREVALPRIVDGDLQARSWLPGDPMSQTPFGALEPQGGRVVAPEEIDVVFTPAVVFDRSGGRVGYGGGFYDRFFPSTTAVRVGVCLGLQVLDVAVPSGGFDLPVQVIVTEGETIRP